MARVKAAASSAKKPKSAVKKAVASRNRDFLVGVLDMKIGPKKFDKNGTIKLNKLSNKEKAVYEVYDKAATEYESWYNEKLGQITAAVLDKVCHAIQVSFPSDDAAQAYSPSVELHLDQPTKSSTKGRKSKIDKESDKTTIVARLKDTVSRERRMAWQALKACPYYLKVEFANKQKIVRRLLIMYNEYFRCRLYHDFDISEGDFPKQLFLGDDNSLKVDFDMHDGPELGRTWPLSADTDGEESGADVEEDGELSNMDDDEPQADVEADGELSTMDDDEPQADVEADGELSTMDDDEPQADVEADGELSTMDDANAGSAVDGKYEPDGEKLAEPTDKLGVWMGETGELAGLESMGQGGVEEKNGEFPLTIAPFSTLGRVTDDEGGDHAAPSGEFLAGRALPSSPIVSFGEAGLDFVSKGEKSGASDAGDHL